MSRFHLQNLAKSYKIIYKCIISEKKQFLHNVAVNKIVLEYTIYNIENIKFDFGKVCILPINIGQVLQNHRKVQYLKNFSLLHSTPFDKKVLEWALYPIETIKNGVGRCLDFSHGKKTVFTWIKVRTLREVLLGTFQSALEMELLF